jgi:hypothetical protein
MMWNPGTWFPYVLGLGFVRFSNAYFTWPGIGLSGLHMWRGYCPLC